MANRALKIVKAFQTVVRCPCFRGHEGIEDHVEERWKRKDWEAILFQHKRACRLRVVLALSSAELLTDKQYWELLRLVWSDSETIFANLPHWFNSLSRRDGGDPKRLFMTDEDRKAYDALPEEFTVYRGYQPDYHNEDGLSWTLDREVAQRLGNRAWVYKFLDKPVEDPLNRGKVREMRVKKSDVFAMVTDRDEEEVILLNKG
jgi:hypothetical protein